MSTRIYKYNDEIDYSKDKFASERFLDSLMFWVIVVVLVTAWYLLK
jgi:hypothetical protein